MNVKNLAFKQKLEIIKRLRTEAFDLNQRIQTAKTERAKKTIEEKLQSTVKDIARIRLLMLPAQTVSVEVQQNNLELLKQLEELRARRLQNTPEFKQAQERLNQRILDLRKQRFLASRKVQKKLFRR